MSFFEKKSSFENLWKNIKIDQFYRFSGWKSVFFKFATATATDFCNEKIVKSLRVFEIFFKKIVFFCIFEMSLKNDFFKIFYLFFFYTFLRGFVISSRVFFVLIGVRYIFFLVLFFPFFWKFLTFLSFCRFFIFDSFWSWFSPYFLFSYVICLVFFISLLSMWGFECFIWFFVLLF